jgi:iron complex outermembrane recepter protein
MKQVCVLVAWLSLSLQVHAQCSLKGTVTDQEGGMLIDAHVTLNNTYYQTITDKNGGFNFTGIKPGTYRLQVSFVGYETYAETLSVQGDLNLSVMLHESAVQSDAVIISAIRASGNTPTTYTMLNKEELNRKNLAQDLPYMLSLEPSVVTTSDAGTGVGYTSLRIRGSDITRINVTINGIPLNDPESHAVYWVDIPDFASSVNSLQLQRGVGSSTNGAGAFGASMNLETNAFQSKPFGLVSLGAGSFNTWKSSFQAGTGLINNHWYFEGRGSAIGSDGYVERASSALNSYFIQGGYYDDKTLIKFMTFGGSEKTYQAWYGVDSATLQTNRRFNWAGAIFEDDGSIRFYDNQTDNYKQNHYQLLVARRLSPSLSLNLAGHYTYGRGYYEEYMQDQALEDYGLEYIDSITSTDLIRRRWLDNHFYGLTWSLHLRKEKTDLIFGGAYNQYDHARHYGEIIWAQSAGQIPYGYEYYTNTAFKNDFNVFTKVALTPVEHLTLYADLQYRYITYSVNGTENKQDPINIKHTYNFLNPKAGISYNTKAGTLYASYGIAHREPIRDDYLDANPGEEPEPELMGNLEIGIRETGSALQYAANYFLMNYNNQLVLTGEINDDGAYIRKNAGKSYRTGIEASVAYKFKTLAEISGNLTLSANKTNYRQVNDQQEVEELRNTDISFSPGITAGSQLKVLPFQNFEIDWLFKYVGKQYLDNTASNNRMLSSYSMHDLRLAYLVSRGKGPGIEFTVMMYNLFNVLYESNGYVYDGAPYYYPQAGIHFMAGLNVKF